MDEVIKLVFEADIDYMQVLQEDSDICVVQLDLLHLGTNRNKTNISKECVEKSLPTFYNKPIIYRLNNVFAPAYSTDVVEHARTDDEEKNIYVGGTIPESSPIEYVERNNKTYLRMTGVVYKLYQQTLYNILKDRNGTLNVSIELKVIDAEKKEDILYLYEFKFLSVCLLGEGIKEGIEGSRLVVTKFSAIDYEKHYIKYKIPDIVKQNAQKGLDLKNSLNKGGTPIGVDLAHFIINNDYLSVEKFNSLYDYFTKHQFSHDQVSWLLRGGDEGFSWIKGASALDSVVNNSEEEDKTVKDEAIKQFSLTSNQIYNILDNAFSEFKYMNGDYECKKYWISDYDEQYVYVYDCEDGRNYAFPYIIENEVATVDFDNKKEVISGGWKIVGENENEDEITNSEIEDEEDYKVKYEELLEECKNMKEKLQEYARAEEEEKMCHMLEEYAHCYSDEEFNTAKAMIKNSNFDEFSKLVDAQIKKYALETKNEKKPESEKTEDINKNTLQFSINPFGLSFSNFNFTKKSEKGLDGIIENSGVRMKK